MQQRAPLLPAGTGFDALSRHHVGKRDQAGRAHLVCEVHAAAREAGTREQPAWGLPLRPGEARSDVELGQLLRAEATKEG